MKPGRKRIRRALLIHQAAIGDFLIACRLAAPCNERLGPHRWSYLGKPALGRLAKTLGIIKDFQDFGSPDWSMLFGPDGPVSPRIQKFLEPFDLILSVICGPDTTFSRRLLQVAGEKCLHIEPKLPENFPGHAFEFLAGQLMLGPVEKLPESAYTVDEKCRDDVRQELSDKGIDAQRLFLIHPGASSRKKCLPLKNFLSLAKDARARGDEPAFLLGEVENERMTREELGLIRSTGRVFADWPLERLACLLASAKSYIGNDNGISHLAAAVGCPTTVCFLQTNPQNWRPLGPKVIVKKNN